MRHISKFDLLTIEELKELIKQSDSYREVILKVGLDGECGCHYIKLKSIIKNNNIDVSHMTRRKNSIHHNKFFGKRPIENYLVKSNKKLLGHLKIRLLEENVFANKCALCGQLPIHNGLKLTLQLDHINGDPTDNTKENLRFLCPNCHSQTLNWGSKNSKLKPTPVIKIKKERKCKFYTTKEELEKLLKEKSMREIGKMFSVSDNAIKKRCIKLGIELESYYWQNKLLHKGMPGSFNG